MEIEKIVNAINICNNINGHIVYDSNLKCICYSAQFLKAKQVLVDFAREELKKKGCVFTDESISS